MPGSTDAQAQLPAIDGWFTVDDDGVVHLIAGKCTQCATYVFPPRENNCPNPACSGENLEQVPLSRRGTLWSYTENRYPPPAPYPAADPFVPFAIAAVELADEQMVVMGQVADGYGVDDIEVGSEVELVVEELFSDEESSYVVWRWKPVGGVA